MKNVLEYENTSMKNVKGDTSLLNFYKDEAVRIDVNLIDTKVKLKDIKYTFDSERKSVFFEFNQNKRITRWALSQFCELIGIPTSYANRCLFSDKFDLLHQNITSWTDVDNEIVLRNMNNLIYSASVSPKARFSLSGIIREFEGLASDYSIKNFVVTPDIMFLRYASNTRSSIRKDIKIGIDIKASNVGRSPLIFNVTLYNERLSSSIIVSNLVSSDKGVSKKDLVALINKSVLTAKNVTSDLEKVSRSAMLRKISDDEIDKIINHFISGEPAINRIKNLLPSHDKTVFGLAQTISEFAATNIMKHREALEIAAGNLLKSVKQ